MTVLPHDRHQCSGCGQLLIFGADGFVARAQLAQCLGRCVWTLVERNGVIVETVPPLNR